MYLIILLVLIVTNSNGQTYEAIKLNARLPSGRSSMPTLYDGEDSIYLPGGNVASGSTREIIKFSISTETIETIGTMVSYVQGSGAWTGNEKMYYIGGVSASEIWQFGISNPSNFTVVNSLQDDCYDSAAVWDNGDNVYIIGGTSGLTASFDTITQLSTSDNSAEVVANLPSKRHATSAIWDSAGGGGNGTGTGYIFGGRTGSSSGYLNDIIKYDSSTDEVTKLNVTLPIQIGFSCSVWTGTEAYIIGGRTNVANNWPSIVRFNPTTNIVTPIQVDNFPEKLSSAGCAFVSKLNRIYVFGGISNNTFYTYDIMYIDLAGQLSTTMEPLPSTTTNPATTISTTTAESPSPSPSPSPSTTTRRPDTNICKDEDDDALVPNPYCCESFFLCSNKLANLIQCPDYLQFSPDTLTCEYPETVGCAVVYRN